MIKRNRKKKTLEELVLDVGKHPDHLQITPCPPKGLLICSLGKVPS